jgi:hypothetical protein
MATAKSDDIFVFKYMFSNGTRIQAGRIYAEAARYTRAGVPGGRCRGTLVHIVYVPYIMFKIGQLSARNVNYVLQYQ